MGCTTRRCDLGMRNRGPIWVLDNLLGHVSLTTVAGVSARIDSMACNLPADAGANATQREQPGHQPFFNPEAFPHSSLLWHLSWLALFGTSHVACLLFSDADLGVPPLFEASAAGR